MTHADIGAGLRLCRAAGWNQLEPDWQFFLNYPCSVAELEGRIAGTVATLPYGWISMILVDPSMRRKGIGSALLKEGLRLLAAVDTVRLDATAAGKQVYDQYGFEDEYPLLRMKCSSTPVAHALVRAAPGLVPAPNLPQILPLDRAVFGADRSPLLRHLLDQAPQYAFLTAEGFVLGRPGHNAEHIGPVVATSLTAAQSLVSAALDRCSGRPCIMDITEPEGLFANWLRSAGFVPERPFVRMYRGLQRPAGIPGRQFAIAGPEFG